MTPEFRYGLLIGFGISVWAGAEFYLGLHTTHFEVGRYTGYFSVLVPLAAIFLLLREKKAATQDGYLTLKEGLVSGLTASFLGGLVVYGFMLSHNRWIDPDWIDNALALKVAALRAHGVDEMIIRRDITSFRWANGTTGLLAAIMLRLAVAGGIISVLLTLALRSPSRSPAA